MVKKKLQILKNIRDQGFRTSLKSRKHFSVRPILRNPGTDLFLGDFTGCCLGMNSNLFPHTMVERLIDEGMNVIEVIDEQKRIPMALLWLYIAEDGSLVIQNIEVHADYEQEGLKEFIGEVMVDYAQEFGIHIGARRVLIGQADHGKYTSFIKMKYGNNKVKFGQDKIGGFLDNERYYLDSAI